MATAYRIKNWKEVFETSDSKRHKSLAWVATPTKRGKGYKRLIRRENGAALYGAFNALLGVAASCPVRGTLADEDGPYDASDLEVYTDIPAALFDELFRVLTDPDEKILWLETVSDDASNNSQTESVVCHTTKSVEPLNYETKRNRTRHNETRHNETKRDETDQTDSLAAPPRSSDSDSVSRVTAELRFADICTKLSRGDDRQLKADRTTAARWWSDIVWPKGLDPPLGEERWRKFQEIARRASDRRKPMAYIGSIIEREIK